MTLQERSILVVDDEPVVRELLKAALAPTGSRLVEACDGSEAIEVAWREHPDLVLLDANPLDNIINTRRIAAVIWNGRVMDADARRKVFERAELAAK